MNFLTFRSFLLLVSILGMPLSASAQDMLDTCDPDVLDVMNLRAQLEGEREMEVAQALILRPDSVLEYSCFQDNVRRLEQFVTGVFSANTNQRSLFTIPPPTFDPNDLYQPTIESRQGPRPLNEGPNSEGIKDFSHPPDPSDNREKYPGRRHFERNVTSFNAAQRGNMVADSLYEYLDRNFKHKNLGGAGPAYTQCDIMKVVWDFAKCDDYYMEIGYSMLKDFPDQYDSWSREWAQCTKSRAPSDRWDDAIKAVNPEPNQSAGVDVNEKDGGGNKTAYVPEMKTGGCGTAKPVKTGVMVNVDGSDREEGVCLRPGCYYNNGSCQ